MSSNIPPLEFYLSSSTLNCSAVISFLSYAWQGYTSPPLELRSNKFKSGRYSRLTQQPLKGRAKKGGQRVGEMEVWALEGFGVAYILQEMLTYKSDHIRARQEVLGTIIFGGRIPTPEDAPESFRLFVRELRSLALELNHFLVSEKTFQLNRKEA
ncbi:RpoB protein [Tanacetum coccineum]